MVFQNPSNPYWQPPLHIERKITFLKPVTQTLGFQPDLMWQLPTTVGEGYSGEGAMPDRRELVFSRHGEYFATDNVVPSTGGRSMVNLYDPIYQFKRSDHTVKV